MLIIKLAVLYRNYHIIQNYAFPLFHYIPSVATQTGTCRRIIGLALGRHLSAHFIIFIMPIQTFHTLFFYIICSFAVQFVVLLYFSTILNSDTVLLF